MKKSLKIGTACIIVDQQDKDARNCYHTLFAFCENHLPACGCDIVCLPEHYECRNEDWQGIKGPIARRFAALAKKHRLYLIAPVAEKKGKKLFNTIIVLSPAGRLVHAYRKVHPAPSETGKITPGRAFNTFRLPWCRAGVMTCFDNQFPESSRALALKGAQIIFWPNFGDLGKPHRNIARCTDNFVCLVSAAIIDLSCGLAPEYFEHGCVLDPNGKMLASTRARAGLAVARLPLKAGKLPVPPARRAHLARRNPKAYR
jgi:predicted amidohydrolase